MSRPGALRRRLQIWRDQGTSQGTYGEALEDWQLLADRWGALHPARGREIFRQESERAQQTIEIVFRWDNVTKTISRKDRIAYRADTDIVDEYDIQSVADVQAEHRYVRIQALKRSPEASRLPAP